jgi:hypothetical protein
MSRPSPAITLCCSSKSQYFIIPAISTRCAAVSRPNAPDLRALQSGDQTIRLRLQPQIRTFHLGYSSSSTNELLGRFLSNSWTLRSNFSGSP